MVRVWPMLSGLTCCPCFSLGLVMVIVHSTTTGLVRVITDDLRASMVKGKVNGACSLGF
jgi:hypothetical protein